MRLHRKHEGFTLTELCVVLAIAALVSTMIVTSVVFFSKQNSDISKDAAFISEVTSVQSTVNDWLKKYDNGGTIVASSTGLSCGEHSLSFNTAQRVFTEDGVPGTQTYKNVSAVQFNRVEGTRVVRARVFAKKGGGTAQKDLLFALFSGGIRERSVNGRTV